MDFNKIKLTDGLMQCEYNREGKFTVTETSRTAPHPDLTAAIDNFSEPFIASLNLDRLPDEVKVSGITIKEGKEGVTVSISGSFNDSVGAFIGISTKPIKIYDEGYEEYNLNLMIESLSEETKKFLFDNKQAQIEMEFPEDSK